ncbi:MAG TPA: hypothetical protein VGM88_18945 [Kofleriaceae bacterium]
MKRQDALLLALCAGAIAFAVAFVWPMFFPSRVAWYYPLAHRWGFEVKSTALAMDFYGRTLLGAIAWCAGFLVTFAIARKLPPAAPRWLVVVAGWALVTTTFVILYFAWTLHFRVPVAAPIPTWYQAR